MANAFGSYEHVPEQVLGMAFVGQMRSGDLVNATLKECLLEYKGYVNQIVGRGVRDVGPNSNLEQNIVAGMKEAASALPPQSLAVQVIAAITALEGAHRGY